MAFSQLGLNPGVKGILLYLDVYFFLVLSFGYSKFLFPPDTVWMTNPVETSIKYSFLQKGVFLTCALSMPDEYLVSTQIGSQFP